MSGAMTACWLRVAGLCADYRVINQIKVGFIQRALILFTNCRRTASALHFAQSAFYWQFFLPPPNKPEKPTN